MPGVIIQSFKCLHSTHEDLSLIPRCGVLRYAAGRQRQEDTWARLGITVSSREKMTCLKAQDVQHPGKQLTYKHIHHHTNTCAQAPIYVHEYILITQEKKTVPQNKVSFISVGKNQPKYRNIYLFSKIAQYLHFFCVVVPWE